ASLTLLINSQADFWLIPYLLAKLVLELPLLVVLISNRIKKAILKSNFTLCNSVFAVTDSTCLQLFQSCVMGFMPFSFWECIHFKFDKLFYTSIGFHHDEQRDCSD